MIYGYGGIPYKPSSGSKKCDDKCCSIKSNLDHSKLPLLTYAKRELAKDSVDTSRMSLPNESYMKCICCRTVALFTNPYLCFGCVDCKTRKCSQGSTNIYYLNKSFMCFEHGFEITAPHGNTCGGCVKPERTLVLHILHERVVDKVLQLLHSDLSRDVVGAISVKLTQLCSIDKAL